MCNSKQMQDHFWLLCLKPRCSSVHSFERLQIWISFYSWFTWASIDCNPKTKTSSWRKCQRNEQFLCSCPQEGLLLNRIIFFKVEWKLFLLETEIKFGRPRQPTSDFGFLQWVDLISLCLSGPLLCFCRST